MSGAQTANAGIEVHVRLFADLRRYLPRGVDGAVSYRLPDGATIEDLLSTIGISGEQEVTTGLNGELAERGTALHDGDELLLISPMEGGI